MNSFLARRAEQIKGSPTLALVALAKELRAKGHDVISLTVGEPDWPTFPNVSKYGLEAIQTDYTKYTAANGSLELRQKIALQASQDFGIELKTQNITVGPGAKFVIYSALYTVLNEGDECLLFSPYWVSYPSMIELASAAPVIAVASEKNNFKLTAQELSRAITPKTKAFLFCSPSNPTGMMYSKKELSELAEVFRKHPQIVILSDDIYNKLVFDSSEVAPHLLHVAPDLANRLISFNGGSKTYSMTGWRIGWASGPAEIIKAMGDFQSQALGAPSSIAQYALEKTLLECGSEIAKVNEMLKKRLENALTHFRQIPEFTVHRPAGAFYLWVDISKALGKKFDGKVIATSKDFCEVLLYKFFVATVPGIECGVEGYMRLSFATDEAKMNAAILRMKEFVSAMT